MARLLAAPSRLRIAWPLILVGLAPSLGTLSALWWWPGTIGPSIYLLCKLVLYGVPTYFLMRTFDRESFLRGVRNGIQKGPLVYGTLSGILISVCILILWFVFLSGAIDFSPLLNRMEESGMNQMWKYLAFAIWLSLGNSLLEEFAFRWFVDGRLRLLGFSYIWVLLISAGIFTVHHVLVLLAFFDTGPAMVFSMGIFIGGLLWSWMHLKWGTLIPGWISHALIDIAVLAVGFDIVFG